MSEKNIEKITKLDSIFLENFVNYNVLSDISFNGHCLIKKILFLSLKK